MELGHLDVPNSYVKFLIDSVTGLNVNTRLVDGMTLTLFILALGASIYTNVRDWKIQKAEREKTMFNQKGR